MVYVVFRSLTLAVKCIDGFYSMLVLYTIKIEITALDSNAIQYNLSVLTKDIMGCGFMQYRNCDLCNRSCGIMYIRSRVLIQRIVYLTKISPTFKHNSKSLTLEEGYFLKTISFLYQIRFYVTIHILSFYINTKHTKEYQHSKL